MDVSILFNWPPGKNSAYVSFNGPTIEDMGYKFRAGIVKKNEKNMTYWLKPGWVFAPDMNKIKFYINIGDSVVAESGDKESEKAITRSVWDIKEEWPNKAIRGSSVLVPWTFH